MLAELIKSIDDWQNKTASQLATALNDSSAVEIVDSQLYTWAGVALIAGPEGAEAFRLALEANGMGWAVHQLGGSGIQLSNPLCQQALAAFAQANVPGASELALAGIHRVSIWRNAGNASDVTVEQVQAALDQLELETTKTQLRQSAAAAYNAFVSAVDAWDGSGNPPVLGG